jgi:hypothetical protein
MYVYTYVYELFLTLMTLDYLQSSFNIGKYEANVMKVRQKLCSLFQGIMKSLAW